MATGKRLIDANALSNEVCAISKGMKNPERWSWLAF